MIHLPFPLSMLPLMFIDAGICKVRKHQFSLRYIFLPSVMAIRRRQTILFEICAGFLWLIFWKKGRKGLLLKKRLETNRKDLARIQMTNSIDQWSKKKCWLLTLSRWTNGEDFQPSLKRPTRLKAKIGNPQKDWKCFQMEGTTNATANQYSERREGKAYSKGCPIFKMEWGKLSQS